jgi:uncharacterized protein
VKLALLVTAVVAGAVGFALREPLAGTNAMWLGLGVPYLLLSALALYRMYDDGTLLDVMRPKSGDLSIGVLLAAVLFGGAWSVRQLAFGGGSPKVVWMFRIALQVGSLSPSPGLMAIIAGVAVLEELVWRGLVLGAVTESLGTRRAWPVTAGLYALAHVPTVFTLADPMAGPNPLLVIAALGAGLVWSFAASIMGRLPAVLVSHAVFSYFAATVLLPRIG